MAMIIAVAVIISVIVSVMPKCLQGPDAASRLAAPLVGPDAVDGDARTPAVMRDDHN